MEQGERRYLQQNGRHHTYSGAWRQLFPYLRTDHITLGMWPPIPVSNPGDSPGLSEACLTRRERLNLGTPPTGPGEQKRETRGRNLYLYLPTGSASVGDEVFCVTWKAAPETDMNGTRGLRNIFSQPELSHNSPGSL